MSNRFAMDSHPRHSGSASEPESSSGTAFKCSSDCFKKPGYAALFACFPSFVLDKTSSQTGRCRSYLTSKSESRSNRLKTGGLAGFRLRSAAGMTGSCDSQRNAKHTGLSCIVYAATILAKLAKRPGSPMVVFPLLCQTALPRGVPPRHFGRAPEPDPARNLPSGLLLNCFEKSGDPCSNT